MAEESFRKVSMSLKRLSSYVDEFVLSLKSKRPDTRGTYQRALREFVKWFSGSKECRFQVKDIEKYKTFLSAERKLSDVSVSTYLTALRRFCHYLADRRVIEGNPAAFVDGFKRPNAHSREILTPSEVQTLFNSIDQADEIGKRDFAIMKLMLGCGLSEIEITRANYGDLKKAAGRLRLKVQGKGRTKKDETVPVPRDVEAALKHYFDVRTQRTRAKRKISHDSPLVVGIGNRTSGRRMSTRGIRERVNFHLMHAGIKSIDGKNITPYSLRHTSGILLANSGASAEEIMKAMRLGSLATAMIYVHQNQKLQDN